MVGAVSKGVERGGGEAAGRVGEVVSDRIKA